jgi:hypothetical protein
MPASATITSFITMVAGTKARATHVNTNFDNSRGHRVPYETNTQAASHQTHDLGSSDHEWRRIYLTNPPFINGTQLGKIEIESVMDGSLPTDCFPSINWMDRVSFLADAESGIVFQFVVPDEYSVGNRLSLSLRGYCETGPSGITMELGSALYKPNVTVASNTAPTNVLTSTSNISVPTTTGQLFTNTSLRLSDASGMINSVTVTAGDVIACYLKRTGTATADTNTSYFHMTNLFIDLNN